MSDKEYTISRDRLFQMISTAFEDGTHFARQAHGAGIEIDAVDVCVESDMYAESFVDREGAWWKRPEDLE